MNGTITAATYTKDTNQVLTTGGIFLCHSNEVHSKEVYDYINYEL